LLIVEDKEKWQKDTTTAEEHLPEEHPSQKQYWKAITTTKARVIL
jgi:hypothetical protein